MRIHRCKSARSHTVFCHGFAHSVQFAHAGQVDAVKGLTLQLSLFAALVGVGRCKLQGVRFQLFFHFIGVLAVVHTLDNRRLHFLDLATGHELEELHRLAGCLNGHFLCKRSGHFHHGHGRQLVADVFLNVDQVLYGHLLHAGQIQAVVFLALELIGFIELHDIVHCCFLSQKRISRPTSGTADFFMYRV